MHPFVTFTLGLALTAAYWPGIAGAATAPRWGVGAAMAVALFVAPPARVTTAHVVGGLLVAWLLLSLAWSPSQLDGIDAAGKLLIVTAAFALGSALDDVRPFVAGAAGGIAISGIVAIAQWFGWSGIESAWNPAGLFYNANRLAEAAAIVLAGVLALRLWWALPGLIPALVIPQARSAAVAVGAVTLIWAWRQGRAVRLAVIALAICLGTIVLTGRGIRLDTIMERIALWSDTISGLTLMGHGLGSFAETFPQYATHFDLTRSRPDHPHNEIIWLAYEGGAVAVGLFGVLCGVLWMARAHALGLVLVAMGLVALVAMPFHDPASILFVGVVAGHVARCGLRTHRKAVARGAPLRAGLAATPAE